MGIKHVNQGKQIRCVRNITRDICHHNLCLEYFREIPDYFVPGVALSFVP